MLNENHALNNLLLNNNLRLLGVVEQVVQGAEGCARRAQHQEVNLRRTRITVSGLPPFPQIHHQLSPCQKPTDNLGPPEVTITY